jgi:hypothetical protein
MEVALTMNWMFPPTQDVVPNDPDLDAPPRDEKSSTNWGKIIMVASSRLARFRAVPDF